MKTSALPVFLDLVREKIMLVSPVSFQCFSFSALVACLQVAGAIFVGHGLPAAGAIPLGANFLVIFKLPSEEVFVASPAFSRSAVVFVLLKLSR